MVKFQVFRVLSILQRVIDKEITLFLAKLTIKSENTKPPHSFSSVWLFFVSFRMIKQEKCSEFDYNLRETFGFLWKFCNFAHYWCCVYTSECPLMLNAFVWQSRDRQLMSNN